MTGTMMMNICENFTICLAERILHWDTNEDRVNITTQSCSLILLISVVRDLLQDLGEDVVQDL